MCGCVGWVCCDGWWGASCLLAALSRPGLWFVLVGFGWFCFGFSCRFVVLLCVCCFDFGFSDCCLFLVLPMLLLLASGWLGFMFGCWVLCVMIVVVWLLLVGVIGRFSCFSMGLLC